MRSIWRRVSAAAGGRLRTSGEPKSANGASSFHLAWDVPQVPLTTVAATLEVLQLPAVRRLYFFALQVTFASERTLRGGAHLGLQWNPGFPGSTAVNWGGYGPADGGSRLLSGSASALASARRDEATRDYPWRPGRRYRLGVSPAPEAPEGVHAWRGTVVDLETGEETVVRDLFTDGPHLAGPMVWSEVFARCEHPTVSVRWSDMVAVTESGEEIRPARVRVNYQPRADGGCDNTSVVVDELGIVQTTSVMRQVPQGALLPVPGA